MFRSSPNLINKSSTINYRASHPSRIITYVLLVFSYSFSCAYAKDMRDSSTCNPEELPDLTATDPSAHFVGPLTPFDTIKENYHVISNTDNFSAVKIFLLGEKHNNITHHKLKVDFVNTWGKLGDRILIEGIVNTTTFICADLCIKPDNQMGLLKSNNSTCKTKPEFKLNITCEGAESAETYENAEKAIRRYALSLRVVPFENQFAVWKRAFENYDKQLKLIFGQIQTLNVKRSFFIEQIERLQIQITALIAILKEMPTQQTSFKLVTGNVKKTLEAYKKNKAASVKTFKEVLEMQNMDLVEINKKLVAELEQLVNSKISEDELSKITITGRNQIWVSRLRLFYSNNENIQYGFFGARHLVPEFENPHRQITSKDPQFELHESLKEIPHAILIPKK